MIASIQIYSVVSLWQMKMFPGERFLGKEQILKFQETRLEFLWDLFYIKSITFIAFNLV